MESCVVSPSEDTSTINIELIKEAECSLERDFKFYESIRVSLAWANRKTKMKHLFEISLQTFFRLISYHALQIHIQIFINLHLWRFDLIQMNPLFAWLVWIIWHFDPKNRILLSILDLQIENMHQNGVRYMYTSGSVVLWNCI